MKRTDEYILCSAIWFDDGESYPYQPIGIKTGFVVTGRRHHDCFGVMYIISGGINTHTKFENEQGFLTNKNRFVTREEAGEIAFDAGQTDIKHERLFSEDLY